MNLSDREKQKISSILQAKKYIESIPVEKRKPGHKQRLKEYIETLNEYAAALNGLKQETGESERISEVITKDDIVEVNVEDIIKTKGKNLRR